MSGEGHLVGKLLETVGRDGSHVGGRPPSNRADGRLKYSHVRPPLVHPMSSCVTQHRRPVLVAGLYCGVAT